MSEGFDYQVHRMLQSGGNPDKALLVTFEYDAERQKDGSFRNVEMIRIWLGKHNEVVRKVTPEDRMRFADRYEAFKRGEQEPSEGTPIKECPLATPADISACKAERIFTLEQLAETPDDRLQRAHLTNLKYKVRDYLQARQRSGFLSELRDELDAVKKENAILKERLDAMGKDKGEPIRRGPGRPKKIEEQAEV